MQILRFDAATARELTAFGSANARLASVADVAAGATVKIMFLEPEGVVGFHQAAARQLFLVVAGSGWLRGAAPERVPIVAGQAALWEAGEWHGSGTEVGMTAVIIESLALSPKADALP